MCQVTRILSDIEQGDPTAAERLLPLVYEELRRLAAQKLAQEKPEQTLNATALVHEAYIRLVESERRSLPPPTDDEPPGSFPPSWNSRGHFFAATAEAMRRILVEQARCKRSLKRGGGRRRVEFSEVEPAIEGPDVEHLALNDALRKLERTHPRKAELVKLRFFTGLTQQQAAEALGISLSTADTDWAYAKSWLRVEMSPAAGDDSQA